MFWDVSTRMYSHVWRQHGNTLSNDHANGLCCPFSICFRFLSVSKADVCRLTSCAKTFSLPRLHHQGMEVFIKFLMSSQVHLVIMKHSPKDSLTSTAHRCRLPFIYLSRPGAAKLASYHLPQQTEKRVLDGRVLMASLRKSAAGQLRVWRCQHSKEKHTSIKSEFQLFLMKLIWLYWLLLRCDRSIDNFSMKCITGHILLIATSAL